MGNIISNKMDLKQATSFLEQINFYEKNGHISYARGIGIENDKIKIYLSENHNGGCDGIDKIHRYYFNMKEFLPTLEKLKENNCANINHNCHYEYYYDLWDQMYHEIDEHKEFTKKGTLSGKLHIKNNKLQIDSLEFKEILN
jgi:hypothetical protein